MDDPVTILRMMERILAVLIGGMAIYLGYRLFFHLPFERGHKGELELPGVKIVLSRVGPGVFFAAFGSIVLFFSLTEQVSVTRSVQSQAESQAQLPPGQVAGVGGVIQSEGFTGASGSPGKAPAGAEALAAASPQQRARALTTIELLNCAQRLLVREAPGAGLRDELLLAIRDAKRTQLLAVWDTDDWGPAQKLGVTGPAADAPFQLRSLFNATYGECPT